MAEGSQSSIFTSYSAELVDILAKSKITLDSVATGLFAKKIIIMIEKNEAMQQGGQKGANILVDRMVLKIDDAVNGEKHLETILQVLLSKDLLMWYSTTY